VVGVVWGEGLRMELVSVVDGALAVASVPFRLGADVGLLLVKVGVDARLVAGF